MSSNHHLFTAANVATMADIEPAYGLIEDAGIVTGQGQIEWVGPLSQLPQEFQALETTDFGDRLVTPGLIDCHTHIVHGGNRAKEFELRLNGASYEEVARAGGGIVSTVKATRAASVEALVQDALPRLDALLAEGLITIEVKSGYGLDEETEIRMLQAARDLPNHRPIRVVTSFLGAHAVPPEFDGQPDAYIDDICIPALAAAHALGLVDAVDGFCEGIAFQPDQIARVFDAAKALNVPVKLHAEQLSNLGGAKLAAQYGALSADHIEYLDAEGVAAMAQAGTVAVVLPGAFYTLRETQQPPLDELRNQGVPIALATDCNPGSSPMTSLLLTLNMACTLFRMTPEESLRGVTCNAAKALGLSDCGTLAAGMTADLAVWDVTHPAELAYRIGFNPLHARIFGGVM